MFTFCVARRAAADPGEEPRSPGSGADRSGPVQPLAPPGGSATVDDACRHGIRPPGEARGYTMTPASAALRPRLSPLLSRQIAAPARLASPQLLIIQQLPTSVAKNAFRDRLPRATEPALRPPQSLSQKATASMLANKTSLATWAALVERLKRGPWALLGILAIVWVADIAAYFFGRAFGKHKLAPSISPGKTWEGAAGAFLGVTAYGLVVGPALGLWVSLPPLAVLSLAILTGVSIMGDLFESLLKRQAGLKDSGSIFPGHGGVLDRIDSVMSSLPVVVLTLHVLSARS